MSLISSLCGKISPLSLDDYRNSGGFDSLKKVLYSMTPSEVVKIVKDSNLKGRGGAAFPAGLKWQLVASEKCDEKYIICNADEGEPGTFKDKVLLEGCPFQILEGMIIAGYAIGAHTGYIYIRGEYPDSRRIMDKAIGILKAEGYLGSNIMGQNFNFNIMTRSGAGAYVCGEETALIESIEGNDGISRFKPPYPPEKGLWGKPTAVNNVETLANIPLIISIGPEEFKKYGTPSSSGTKLVSVSGNVAEKGVYEVEFGTSIREIIYDICGGIEGGRKLKFVQLGGSSGICLPPELIDTKLDFDELKKIDAGLGSGALIVFDDSNCIVDFARNTMEFFRKESCGKCTPCREGNRHLLRILDRISQGEGTMEDIDLLKSISSVMCGASMCGLGQAAPTAVVSTLKYFPEEYEEHIKGYCRTGVCGMRKEGAL